MFQHLHRLAQKPGVQSTLILLRATGAIVHSTGLPTREEVKTSNDANSANGHDISADIPQKVREHREEVDKRIDQHVVGARKTAEDIARIVLRLFAAAEDFARDLGEERQGMGQDEDGDSNTREEELRLLRLRLRKREVVVVPDTKFILVVIHEPQTS